MVLSIYVSLLYLFLSRPNFIYQCQVNFFLCISVFLSLLYVYPIPTPSLLYIYCLSTLPLNSISTLSLLYLYSISFSISTLSLLYLWLQFKFYNSLNQAHFNFETALKEK